MCRTGVVDSIQKGIEEKLQSEAKLKASNEVPNEYYPCSKVSRVFVIVVYAVLELGLDALHCS